MGFDYARYLRQNDIGPILLPLPAPARPPREISSGIGVVAIRDGKFLVAERLAGASGGVGRLSLPGGKVEFGEPIYLASLRELNEETGLIGVPREIFPGLGYVFHTGEKIGGGEHHISYYVAVDVTGGELENREPSKHSDWMWVGLDEFSLPYLGFPHWLPLDAMHHHREALSL